MPRPRLEIAKRFIEHFIENEVRVAFYGFLGET